ncbi:TonB-dependent receptor domain-containing protein [Fusobacterium necrophorum]|uniref:TonB-dependent receptor domain-containing protein n=1 Tax=Fusobacterium necrophorum TaxID=859 RepID=UPI00254A7B1D|nr:TonB-dependent receptor [Fusobacterium necrophorum]MDK4521780.1 TonB-dependent receptor [Fusobacterium necrophorum]
MRKNFLLASFLVFGVNMAFAEENPVLTLEQTIVSTESFGTSARKTARNVRVMTEKEIKEKGASTIEEALKGIPGVIVRRIDGSAPIIDLRGTGMASSISSTLLLLNGVPLNGLIVFDINSIPINEVERIEIIQGGGALMYGDGAVGGMVNIITKSPKNKKYFGSVNLELGSWKTKRANINYGMKVGEKLSVNASYSGYSSMDYRDRYHGMDWTGQYLDYRNRADKKYSVWFSGKYDLQDGNIELRYNHTENRDIFAGSLDKKQFQDNPKQTGGFGREVKNISDVWNVSYQKALKENLEFSLIGGHHQDKSILLNQISSEYFIKPQLKYRYGKNSYLIFGGDYKNGKRVFKSPLITNHEKAPDDKRKAMAFYFMNKFSNGKWEFSQGYRRERVEYDYTSKAYRNLYYLSEANPVSSHSSNNNSFELGVNYLYTDTGNMYFNYTRAVRTPTIEDAKIWYGEVKSKKSDIFEIGMREYFKNTLVSSSIFYMNAKNEVYYDTRDMLRIKSRNFDGTVRRVGAQLALSHYLGKFILKENISYVNPKIVSGPYKGKTFVTVPNWILNLGAAYRFSEQFLINADLYYQSKMYAEDDFENILGKDNSYVTLNMNASYKFDNGIEIYGGIKNLLNERYADTIAINPYPSPKIAYYPGDGRNFYMGFRYQF